MHQARRVEEEPTITTRNHSDERCTSCGHTMQKRVRFYRLRARLGISTRTVCTDRFEMDGEAFGYDHCLCDDAFHTLPD